VCVTIIKGESREHSQQLGCVSLTMINGVCVCLTIVKGECLTIVKGESRKSNIAVRVCESFYD